jgi:hypothetical protein
MSFPMSSCILPQLADISHIHVFIQESVDTSLFSLFISEITLSASQVVSVAVKGSVDIIASHAISTSELFHEVLPSSILVELSMNQYIHVSLLVISEASHT